MRTEIERLAQWAYPENRKGIAEHRKYASHATIQVAAKLSRAASDTGEGEGDLRRADCLGRRRRAAGSDAVERGSATWATYLLLLSLCLSS